MADPEVVTAPPPRGLSFRAKLVLGVCGLRINRSRITGGRTRQVEHDMLPDGTWKEFKADDDSGYDPRVRPFYTGAKEAGRLTWLRPYFFLLGSVPGTTCAAPVTDAAG